MLLVSLDTTRTDHLGCYGGTASKTPNLDSLASEGTLFEDAMCTAPTTLASHTSIMTGLHPRRHGVARNGFMVNQDNVMLAEVLKLAGFHTAGFLGSYALDSIFDFNQGFEAWDANFAIEYAPLTADQNQRRAEDVTKAVLKHVDEVGSEGRLFLFAHYFDAHAPYDPPAPFGERYAIEAGRTSSNLLDLAHQEVAHYEHVNGKRRSVYNEGLTVELLEQHEGEPLPGDAHLAAMYAGEVAYMDHHLGQLFDGLRERGILDDCIVVVVADHGETFWEHADAWHHGAWVYQTNVHVPLIMRLPDGRGAGLRVAAPVSTVDLFPTLLELLGIELPEAVDGVSFLPALDGASLPQRSLFSEATQPVNPMEGRSRWANQLKPRTVRRGRWKYIEAPYIKHAQLFDLQEDPGERVNLLLSPTPRSKVELPRLRNELRSWASFKAPRSSRFNSTQSDEVMRRLEALGYTGKD